MENNSSPRKMLRKKNAMLKSEGLLAVAALLLSLIACSPVLEVGEEEKPPHIIEEWPEPMDTIYITTDSVRDMTHADSIRFGYIVE